MSVLSAPYFHDEAAAFEKLESVIWPNGPVCPHCGETHKVYAIKPNVDKRVRIGLKKCGACRKQFTVKVGTVFEHGRVPLNKFLQAVYLMCSSKKGVSSKQLERTLEVTYKTAWFMAHRIREAMRSGDLAPFGGNGGTVEVDETFIGHDKAMKPRGEKKGRGYHHKFKVLSLIDRETGQARSMVVDDLKAATLIPLVQANVAKEARVFTDEAGQYHTLGRHFAEHDFVRHNKGEYGRGEVHTNTIEGYFSVFKRGMKGVYQHCGKHHLHRYLAEYDFRYNHREKLGVDDKERTDAALTGIVGKRLTYRRADGIA
ncbi:ISSpo8, transposase [Glycocaulis alkaliphilus]|uniref:ISSpo8, transposase n=1 Tax=Glycocaulis alkaliphilus TaxID=1434191 RepID=A0A3T0ED80_9PROT|nr:IS1595 family transposase [Glycocaulis alkaliphilus]AZU05248.1 ISSpo8, transposase [Glycocaulis alkaliphilus]GGB82102.1 DDE transposase [Glycocaulis alkaliphilus]